MKSEDDVQNLALPGHEISATYHADDQLETGAKTISNWLLWIAAGMVVSAGMVQWKTIRQRSTGRHRSAFAHY